MALSKPIVVTALLEGAAVLVVEIAGARALAPFFGASLTVWTAQITATLLFLALGYALGGRLSRAPQPLTLPVVFWGAGLWLALYPWVRTPVLTAGVGLLGFSAGSFAASASLFGPVLLCLGAVSPLLIQRAQSGDRGGAAAGAVFFVNTLGGLAGGWLTALVLLPHVPLRWVLAGTGWALAMLGVLWARPRRRITPSVGLLLLALAGSTAPRPVLAFRLGPTDVRVVHSENGSAGLIQVLDLSRDGHSERVSLLVNGIAQGAMDRASGLTVHEYTESQARLSWVFCPKAERALLLGLGNGLLAKSLHERGLTVDVVEIEPRMESVARRWFGLPDAVRVHIADGRTFLSRGHEQWDLLISDAFIGENPAWYLMTLEGLRQMQGRLAPGGRLVMNFVTREDGRSVGMQRLEAALLQVFGEGQAYVEAVDPSRNHKLVNAYLVAGRGLRPASDGYPGRALEWVNNRVRDLLGRGRPLRPGEPSTDELSDVDAADAALRQQWRSAVLAEMGAETLGD